jgi:sialic acid synthase SpsE
MVDWIAEIGSCHKGQSSLAYRMVKEFAQAGATTIKFQAGRDPSDPIRYADPWLPAAKLWCDMYDVEFLASCWSPAGLDLCKKLGVRRRKIAHQQVNLASQFMLDMMETKGDVIISVDPANPEHRHAKYCLQYNKHLKWLFVGSEYPTFPQEYKLPIDFGTYSGYSNHTHGIAAPLHAVAHGAQIIECHVTLDPTEESIKDNHFACTPDEFSTMVRLGNEIARLGDMHGDSFRSTNWG